MLANARARRAGTKALYAITKMHGINPSFIDQKSAELLAGVDKSLLRVATVVPYKSQKLVNVRGGHGFITGSMFATNLKATEHCTPALIELLTGDFWRVPIELMPDLKLAPL